MGFLNNISNMFKREKKENTVNSRGDKDGFWRERNGYTQDGGIIQSEGHYKDGKKEGKWIENFEGIEATGDYVNGNKEGKWTTINRDNSILEENYVNGFVEGISKEFYPPTIEKDSFGNPQLLPGTIKEERNFVNGKLDGISKEYYESGKLKEETEYENGKMITYQKYNEKGVLIEDIDIYKLYQRVHERFSESEKGYVRVVKTYDENGKAEGDWKFYKENGNIEKVMLYTNGKLTEESKKEPSITEIGYVHYVYNGHEDVQRIEYAPKEDEYMKIYHLKDGTKDIYHEKEGVTLYEKQDEKGAIVERGQFDEESKQTGTWEYYDNSGKLTEKKEFQEGKEVEKEKSSEKKNPWVKSKGKDKESENER